MKYTLYALIAIVLLIGVALGVYLIVIRQDPTVIGGESEGLEAVRPRDMRIVEVESDAFLVKWETKDSISGYIKYGDTSNSITLMAQDVNGTVSSTRHEVRVSNLSPGKKYYFWVMSDDIAFGRNGRALEVLTLSK